MYKTLKLSRPSAPLNLPFLLALLFALAFTLVLTTRGIAQTQDVDDQYVHVLAIAQQGEALKTAGDNTGALAKYREAQKAMQVFRKDHPDWNVKVVTFRSNIITEKIAALTGETPAAAGMPGTSETCPSKTAPKA